MSVDMLLPIMRERLLASLSGTPDVVDELVRRLMPHDPAWDLRPDPNRYTLREILAHLYALETRWYERIAQTSASDGVTLPLLDIAALEVEFEISTSDPVVNREKFREKRLSLVRMLKDLDDDHWLHIGYWPRLGEDDLRGKPVTLEAMAAFVTIHDGYHTAQIAQWLGIARNK